MIGHPIMKLSYFLLALVCLSLSSVGFAEEGVVDLSIGAAAPDFELPGIDGKTYRLADFQDGKVLVVFFTSNHCPTSHGAADRLKTFLADYRPQGMEFVAINPNHPDGLSIDELGYSKYGDGFEDMKKYAAEEGFDFPYLYDGETQAVAKAYGCLATPHVFVFDEKRKLRYKGGFDDSRFGGDDSTVKTPYTRNAVKAILAGESVPVEITRPEGCSTKWRSKQAVITKKMERWNQVPVDVEPIDAEGVAELRAGGTSNVRLYNVWATWCAPCIVEFPELISASRQYDMRNFEFISISADDPKELPTQLPKIKAFLEKNNAGLSPRLQKSVKAEGRKSNSYVYTGEKLEDLMKALDPEWPGGLPHTVLVDTNGKILWRKNGPVTGDELRDQILGHLGNYYTR
jgi:peroxiredoxin